VQAGYILKYWFDKDTDVLELLDNALRHPNHPSGSFLWIDDDNVICFWNGVVTLVHNSWGESLRASEKIKVYVWAPPVFGRLLSSETEDKLGDQFVKEVLNYKS